MSRPLGYISAESVRRWRGELNLGLSFEVRRYNILLIVIFTNLYMRKASVVDRKVFECAGMPLLTQDESLSQLEVS